MPQYLSPGVYVEELDGGARPIEGVGTAVAAFVGLAQRGPFNEPTLVTNWTQFVTTNLRANLDEAFARRLDSVIDFQLPDAEFREVLWERCLGPEVPRGDDLDLAFAAKQFELSGGNIRSIAVTAAYFAAETARPIGMLDLMRATQREYRKLGRLCVESESGSWYSLVMA